MERSSIGRYQILKSLGKGGMGEVFLAYDPLYKRKIAIKCLREDFKNNSAIKNRFLKEAKIAGQLTHPSIIPIYAINSDPLYYTMTYVEGKTLKELLQKSKSTEISISSLTRIFLKVCEAIAYTHSKEILHRDLKPENIIVGKYGEAFILDWGIAAFINENDFIKPGKIAGTLCYMAPEKAFGEPSSILTDIYALGTILYQILTLEPPFKRPNLAEFKKNVKEEKLVDPIEKAPLRDISSQLNKITKKCLAFQKEERYQNVEDLITDLKNYIDGNPEWTLRASLDMDDKKDWEFQENVLLAKHIAITKDTEIAEWVSLMISKKSFPGNIKMEADLILKNSGIGFLLSIPEERKGIEEGYCVWISPHSAKLFRSNVLVKEVLELGLNKNKLLKIKIEKINNELIFYLDSKIIFSHQSHWPLLGNRVGILHKNVGFTLKNLLIYSNSYNVNINCLAVPDAFFRKKMYDSALFEYREIANSFPGRKEEKDAIFRAGLTLIEKAKKAKEKESFFQEALQEFEKLHLTTHAPLEYLGKALVYQAKEEVEEEAKCLELAIRKFKDHLLTPIIKEHIIYRMHESSLQNREATYRLALITLRHLPEIAENRDTARLINSIEAHMDPLFFIEEDSSIAIKLAFWLNKKTTLLEIVKEPLHKSLCRRSREILNQNVNLGNELTSLKGSELENSHSDSKDPRDLKNELVQRFLKDKTISETNYENGLFALLELGYYEELKTPLLEIARNNSIKKLLSIMKKKPSPKEFRVLIHILRNVLFSENLESFLVLKKYEFNAEQRQLIDALLLQKLLLEEEFEMAKKLLNSYSEETLNSDYMPLYFPYHCYLYLSGKIKNFPTPKITPQHPRINILGMLFLEGEISFKSNWMKHSFYWEQQELFRQLYFFYGCVKDQKKQKHFKNLCIKNP